MNKFHAVLALLAASFLSGCLTTPYQPADSANMIPGGFRQKILEHNLAIVEYVGNGFVSDERAKDFALLRAAEICLSTGYPYMVLLQGDHRGFASKDGSFENTGSTTSQNSAWNTSGWGQASALVCFLHNKPEQFEEFIDPVQVIEALSLKYELQISTSVGTFAPDTVKLRWNVNPLYKSLPETDAQNMIYRRSVREMGFEGIQIAQFWDLEDPFVSPLDTQEKLRTTAAKIGAGAVVVTDEYPIVHSMQIHQAAAFVASAYLVPQAQLGIQWEPGDLNNQKYVIRRFYPNSLCAEAGLKLGDRVLAVNQIDLLNVEGFHEEWLSWKEGQTVVLTVVRDGEEREFKVSTISNRIL